MLRIIKFFTIYLLFALSLDAANIKIITKYGKTGGIAGRLNTTSDKINGRLVCENNPTAGCDFANNPGWSDNGTPNDGSDDTYSGDLLVRTNDLFEVVAAWSWNGNPDANEDTVTLKSTLPQGYEWSDLPGSCDASLSSLSEDRKSIVCVRKDFDKNQVGTVAEDLTFAVRVLGSNQNGAKPGDISFEISAQNATTQSDNAGASLTVTAAPRWNLQKSRYGHKSGFEFNGQKGFLIYYKYYVEVDEVNGETDDAPAYLGSESMGADATFIFKDDLSGVSPNAKLYDCLVDYGANSNDPYPYATTTYPERSIATPKGTQKITCNQNGSLIDIKLEHVDATLNHIPRYDQVGRKLPVNRAIATIGAIRIFVPLDDVKNGKDGQPDTNDDGQLQTVNKLINFDPTAPSGNSNFGSLTESEKDNSYSLTLYYAKGGFSKGYAEKHGVWSYREGGSAGWRTGDGLLSAGAVFASRLGYTNEGGIPFHNSIICDVFDANRLEVINVPAGSEHYHRSGAFDVYTGGGLDFNDLEFEYASTYVNDSWLPSKGGDLNVNHSSDIVKECSDSSVVWYSSLEEAKQHGLKTVTKVRIKLKPGKVLDSGQNIYAWLNHKVRAKTLDGQPLQNGDEIVNYATIKDDDYFTSWYQTSYIPHEYPNPPEGWAGDRVTYSGGKVRIEKSVNKNNFEPGQKALFTLNPSYTNDTGSQQQSTVVIKDMLPVGLHYVPSSAQNASEPTIGTCNDINDSSVTCTNDNQVLIWNLGTKTTNEDIAPISYEAQIEATAPQGTMTNYAYIESPADVSVVSQRRSDVNINITIPATINLSKSVLNTEPQETNGEPIRYAVDARNGSDVQVTDLDMIDILPFNGDGNDGAIKFRDLNLKRRPGTHFNGTRGFESLKLIAHPKSPALCDLSPSVKYYYTNAEPTTINMSPKDTSNALGSGSIWCEGDENGPASSCGFTKAQVTAVRAMGPSMDKDAVCQMQISMSVQNNQPGDFYNNSAGASATGVTLPVLSNSASTVIVKSKVGDYIWFDANANGIQDAGESGINDIEVKLYKADGTLVATTKSANDADGKAGYYAFDNLHSGDYYIQITPPSGFHISPKDAGSDDEKDSDIDTQGKTAQFYLGVKSEDLKYDAGIYKPSSIGSTIWYDTNHNGVQESGEDCRNIDLNVSLLDSANHPIQTQTTHDCHYLFVNLLPGTYKVKVDLPQGFETSPKDQGSDTTDSDFDTTHTTDPILINNGIDKLDIALGFYTKTSLGDHIWIDSNANGIQDQGEKGIANVTVELLNADGSTTGKSTTSDANGIYRFVDLLAGDYKLKFTAPQGYKISPHNSGSDDTKDSDLYQSLITSVIHLTLGTEDMSWDLGLYQEASIGDMIWIDSNGNGIQDSGEDCKGVNIEVTLVEINQTQTTQNCHYKFEHLKPGSYSVKFETPQGYSTTQKGAGSDQAKDNDIDENGQTISYTLVSGQNIDSVDAGYLKNGQIGDKIWLDANHNGLQDSGEKGFADINVTLLDSANHPIKTVKTDSSGKYLFSDLKPDHYAIKITVPEGFKLSQKDQGGDESKDSDIDPSSKQSASIQLHSGEHIDTLDGALYSISSIGDRIWLDSNANGIQDEGEKGVANVTVELLKGDGTTTELTTKSDANGIYIFENLVAGDYIVKFTPPTGYEVSPKDKTADDKDSDVNVQTLKSQTVHLGVNQHIDTLDMGLFKRGSISDTFWIDDNNNGLQDSGEDCKGINLKVTLHDEANSTKTVTTQDCHYQFANLVPGKYTVSIAFPEHHTPASYHQGDDTQKDNDIKLDGKSEVITLVSAEDRTDIDIGLVKDGAIGDRVWLDSNKNGIQDADEKGIAGVEVALLKGDNSPTNLKTTTNAEGIYSFSGIKPGSYRVKFTIPNGYYITAQNQGSDEAKDSDVDPATQISDNFTLVSDQSESRVDMGLYTENELGDIAWLDTNANGLQDAGEKGLSDVNITLVDAQGKEVRHTVSDANGHYLFQSLPEGSYRVKVALPSGYHLSDKDRGDDAKDSDIDPKSALSQAVALASNTKVHTLDIGLYQGAEIGDTIWLDANGNGVQDSGEKCPDTDLDIDLVDANGKVVKSVTTQACKYSFSDVKPGKYKLHFKLPKGTTVTKKGVGGNDKDSDIDANGTTELITLTSNEKRNDIDAGFMQNGSIGDFIWLDANTNGIQDADEKGVSDITVELLDESLKPTGKSVKSDKDGHYQFDDLSPAKYAVKVVLPQGFVLSPNETGNDRAKDSNFDRNSSISKIVTVGNASHITDIDAGVYALGELGDRVWLDLDANGIQDAKEKGIKDIAVTLIEAKSKRVVAQTTTDKSGNYLFRGLKPDLYRVKFAVPDGYRITFKHKTDAKRDSDVNTETNATDDIRITSGTKDHTIDMGLIALKSISGKVESDIDNDKKAELPLKDVKVELHDCQGEKLLQSATTDAKGSYRFDGLIPGCYRITEIDPKGYTSVTDVDGVNDNNISVKVTTKDITGQNFLDEPLLKISGQVRADMDFDNKITLGKGVDKVLPNVTVTLFEGEKKIGEVKSNKEGNYLFEDITPGHYVIVESDPKGFDSIRDVDGENDNNISVTLSTKDIVGQNFDDQKTITVSGTVRVDIDGDRKVDEILPNSKLLLCKTGIVCTPELSLANTYTDENGSYTFEGLKPGDYQIVQIDKKGYESLRDKDGGNNNIIKLNLDGKEDVKEQNFEDLAIAPMFVKIHKTVLKKEVKVGDFVPYSIRVENVDKSFRYGALQIRDLIPAGFKYAKGSAKLKREHHKAQKLNASGSRSIAFGPFELKPKEVVTVTYLLKVGVSVSHGKHINKAIAVSNDEEVSNLSKATVRVESDPFIDNAVVIGKVFEDLNGNGIQDKGERGIPGVRIATVEGMVIETDAYGRYHIADNDSGGFGWRGKNIILKVDPATLPEGAKFTTENPRVYRVTASGLNQIDFGVKLSQKTPFAKTKTISKVVIHKEKVWVSKLTKLGSVYFDSDQDCIRPDQVPVIEKLVEKIKEYDGGAIRIEGNTDARAPMWYNKKLAYKRAQSVYKELKHRLGDAMIDKVEVIYNNCSNEVKFNPLYDWWGKPNAPRTPKECTRFGIKMKDCHRLLQQHKGGAQ